MDQDREGPSLVMKLRTTVLDDQQNAYEHG